MAVVGKDDKQPHEVLDWDVDFSVWLPEGDELDEVVPSVRRLSGSEDSPLVVDRVQNTVSRSKVWVSGGAHGAKYRVQLAARTVGGRLKEAEFDITVKEI